MSWANILGSKLYDVFGKSLTLIRHNKGPIIETCGTPHIKFFKGWAIIAVGSNILFMVTEMALKYGYWDGY